MDRTIEINISQEELELLLRRHFKLTYEGAITLNAKTYMDGETMGPIAVCGGLTIIHREYDLKPN